MFPHYLKAYSEMNVLLSSAKQLLSLEYTTYFRNSLNHLMCVCVFSAMSCYVILKEQIVAYLFILFRSAPARALPVVTK